MLNLTGVILFLALLQAPDYDRLTEQHRREMHERTAQMVAIQSPAIAELEAFVARQACRKQRRWWKVRRKCR